MSYVRWKISPQLEEKMRDVARRLRRESTPTEQILWQQLRRKQLGHKIHRQTPIGPFVVDFLCPSARLIIEVDGPIHDSQREDDQWRQSLLEELGLRFIRFTTRDVATNLPDVLAAIRTALNTPPSSSNSQS
jgi:very-short-patch-repair endonuclease